MNRRPVSQRPGGSGLIQGKGTAKLTLSLPKGRYKKWQLAGLGVAAYGEPGSRQKKERRKREEREKKTNRKGLS